VLVEQGDANSQLYSQVTTAPQLQHRAAMWFEPLLRCCARAKPTIVAAHAIPAPHAHAIPAPHAHAIPAPQITWEWHGVFLGIVMVSAPLIDSKDSCY
jgi:hypothetical protein